MVQEKEIGRCRTTGCINNKISDIMKAKPQCIVLAIIVLQKYFTLSILRHWNIHRII